MAHTAPETPAPAWLAWLTPRRRRRAYAVLAAAGVVAATYGAVTHDQLAVWLGLANAILGTQATAFTDTR